jgi:copper chaperone CopZ
MMKNATKLVTIIAVVAALGALGWVGRAAAGDEAATTVSTFAVQGMTCGGCEVGVKMKVKKLAGVESVDASHKEGTARVVYDPSRVTPEQIIAAIEELGYKAELQETETQTSAGARSGLRAFFACC